MVLFYKEQGKAKPEGEAEPFLKVSGLNTKSDQRVRRKGGIHMNTKIVAV